MAQVRRQIDGLQNMSGALDHFTLCDLERRPPEVVSASRTGLLALESRGSIDCRCEPAKTLH
jgi:hypothetical protein